MKKYSHLVYPLTLLVLVGISSLLSSCKDEEPSEREKTETLLTSGTWTMSNVTVDGVNKNDLFTGFTLTVGKNTYTASNGTPVWSNSGTWQFVEGSASALVRDDQVVVSITSLTESALTLTLTWDKTTFGNGRSYSVSGEHTFEFTR